MTLKIENDLLEVKNSNGVTKFTSNNKLVYERNRAIGTVNLYGTSLESVYPLFQYRLKQSDFVHISIKILQTYGNAIDASLIGKWIPANGSIVTNFVGRGGSTGLPEAETCVVGVAVDSTTGNLIICEYKATVDAGIKVTNLGLSFQYDIRVFSYF